MEVPHDAMVVVVDGRKLLMLRNAGDAAFPDLKLVDKQLHPNPSTSDQKTDSSGMARSTQSGPGAPAAAQGGSMHAQGAGAQFAPARGTLGEPDFHQLEEDRFAAEVAAMLKDRALRGDFESLIIIAAPKTLGVLRQHYHGAVRDRLAGELAKDLTDHPVPEIEAALRSA